MSLLFFGKVNDPYCKKAVDFIGQNFNDFKVFLGKRGDNYPLHKGEWEGDYIISYLSPWIIPEHTLKCAKRASINFHPGPPEYPGIGCTNFALYNGESTFGITCHHMLPKVDTGQIIAVKRFKVFDSDSVYSLTQRCYAFILTTFYEVVSNIISGEPIQLCGDTWKRKPYKRDELNALCKITSDMTPEEVARRVRAVTFPGAPGAFTEVGGIKFIVP